MLRLFDPNTFSILIGETLFGFKWSSSDCSLKQSFIFTSPSVSDSTLSILSKLKSSFARDLKLSNWSYESSP
jgi:hypothetical protein